MRPGGQRGGGGGGEGGGEAGESGDSSYLISGYQDRSGQTGTASRPGQQRLTLSSSPPLLCDLITGSDQTPLSLTRHHTRYLYYLAGNISFYKLTLKTCLD